MEIRSSNNLVVQVGAGGAGAGSSNGLMISSTQEIHKKSPSYHSSENMSTDGGVIVSSSIVTNNPIAAAMITNVVSSENGDANACRDSMGIDEPISLPCYDDHWHYETIVLEREPGVSLGFSIAGGTDNPMYGYNTSIFITKLTPNGLCEKDGRLKANDILYKVNNVVLDDVEHSEAVKALKDAGNVVSLVYTSPTPFRFVIDLKLEFNYRLLNGYTRL